MDVDAIVALYAQGLFPMDDPAAEELPWYAADPRTVFDLDAATLARARRTVRRSLRAGEGWQLRLDLAFDEVIAACGRPRHADDGVWLTPRMHALYRALHARGLCHTFEIWVDGELGAGLVAVTLRRAAMLESMFHRVPHAGNVLLVRTLEELAGGGCELVDLQLSTEHTLRLGAREVPRAEYDDRLRRALR
ncbi:MAG: leucyl/phenylalanyl-tRNA--protein transferase [Solirubrobacterales bacterium]|nr:leucyl/phenylalanyl-tRNA--protein transferase [Solirubrobacterales bacterium]